MEALIYTKPNCTYCDQAKSLLASRGIPYTEVHFDVGQPKMEGFQYVSPLAFKDKYPDTRSAPQIFVDGHRVGGFAELREMLAEPTDQPTN